jgi:DNA-binding transcriptional MerR regulator
MDTHKTYLKVGEASEYIGVCPQTIRNYHDRGILVPEMVLDSGHRYYSVEQLDKFIKKVK